jgi:hypothetical protein
MEVHGIALLSDKLQEAPMNILFICSQNMLRSPTAEAVLPPLAFFFSPVRPPIPKTEPPPQKIFTANPPKTQQIRLVNSLPICFSPQPQPAQPLTTKKILNDLPCPTCYSVNKDYVRTKPRRGLLLCA